VEKAFETRVPGHQMATVALSLALFASTTLEAVAITPLHERKQFLAASLANTSMRSGLSSAAIKADMDLLSRVTERGTIFMAMEQISDTLEDSVMGSDLSVLQLSALDTSAASRRSGPATLHEYCTQPAEDDDPDEGDRVMADWKGYGTLYPGTVEDENRNGTYDIMYDDGWEETRVKERRVDEYPDPSAPEAEKEKKKPAIKNDAACKLHETLNGIKEGITNVGEKIASWSLGQRSLFSGQRPLVRDSSAAAPAPAPESEVDAGNKADELSELKEMLAAKDAEVKELKEKVAANKDRLQGLYAPAAAPAGAPAPPKTVDDLIAEYKAKIAGRDQEIKELKATLLKQEQELASLGAITTSLDDIEDAVDKLADDVAKAEKKREELSEAGELDPELRVGIEGITESMQKLYSKVKELKELDRKAREQRELAEEKKRKAKAAAEAAAQEAAAAKAEAEAAEAKNDAAAARAAALKAAAAQAALQKADADIAEADATAKEGDAKVLQAAGEVDSDLQKVQKGAHKLDTGVHPHGDKWWRYRYEHSYVEALLMLVITFLMSIFGAIHEYMRMKASNLAGDMVTEEERIANERLGFLYRTWLKQISIELMVCLNVFLTVWIASKTRLLDYLPILMPSTDAYHLPNTGLEYKHCAIDICVVLFFAIIFYYLLMLSVVHYSFKMCAGLEEMAEAAVEGPSGVASLASSGRRITLINLGHEELELFSDFFIRNVQNEISVPERAKDYRELLDENGRDLQKFPFWKYLILIVRASVPELLRFGLTIWLPVTMTFGVFMLVHRFLAMGYLRIMGLFAVLVVATFLVMCRFIYKACKVAQSEDVLAYKPGGFHERVSTELWITSGLQYVVYMLCYGFARMICQKWMWELHFWPVLAFTIVAIVLAALFVVLVAPIIPEFNIAMGMPPYMDAENIKLMQLAVQKMKTSHKAKNPLDAARSSPVRADR